MGVDEGREWQVGVWDRMSGVYQDRIDDMFVPVVDAVLARARVQPGERVLDLGTGTGAVAAKAARAVAPDGDVLATDISPEMLKAARMRAERDGIAYRVEEGGGESIPAPDGSFDVVLASLSLMYVVDRAAAAREIARVLRPGGRLVASVWAGPEVCDIVRFQQKAGSFAPAPPVPGVGPGALADPAPFLEQLGAAGVDAWAESETLGFDLPTLEAAWEVLAGVTTAGLSPEQRAEAKEAVRALMWEHPDRPRAFRNATLFLVGERRQR